MYKRQYVYETRMSISHKYVHIASSSIVSHPGMEVKAQLQECKQSLSKPGVVGTYVGEKPTLFI
jgi:hypothetical protein